jgi:hypothetical protein
MSWEREINRGKSRVCQNGEVIGQIILYISPTDICDGKWGELKYVSSSGGVPKEDIAVKILCQAS